MNSQLVILFAPLSALLTMLALSNLTRRDLLFGVPVPQDFRSTGPGRHAIRSYRLTIAAIAAFVLPALAWTANPIVMIATLLAMPGAGMAAFVAQDRKLQPYAIQPPQRRVVDLTAQDSLPWYGWLGLGPLALLAASALYLRSQWDKIPARFAIHFDLNGTPNGWADRTVRGVYGPLMIAGEIAAVLLVIGLAGWYGSRRSEPMRKPILVLMIAADWTIAVVLGAIALNPAVGFAIPVLGIALCPMLFLAAALAYAVHQSRLPSEPLDPTPSECWKGGLVYYNPDDAALFVQRHDGMGFTFNMANHWSWILCGTLILVIASLPLILG